MNKTGIIFSTEMVRAILEGRKTQTRRVIKDKNVLDWLDCDDVNILESPSYEELAEECPYGVPGDRLWVRETWKTEQRYDDLPPREIPRDARILFLADNAIKTNMGIFHPEEIPLWFGKVRSAMFMCRWMSRLVDELTEVRAERLQEISFEDAGAEGFEETMLYVGQAGFRPGHTEISREEAFHTYWDSLNAKRGHPWESDPWVWVISFTRQEK